MAVQVSTLTRGFGNGAVRAWLQEALYEPASASYRVTMRVIVSLIILSVATIVIESVAPLYAQYRVVVDGLETLIVAAFTAEFLANLYAAEDKRRYLTSVWGVIDLLAILPSYLSALHLIEVKAVRTLRVVRVLRVLKLMKVASTRATESAVRTETRRHTFSLDIQIYFIALFTVVVISSTLAYYAETDVPGTLFNSIPSAMWWAIVTITSTGYGDMVPHTFWGRIVATGTMLSGLALFGILTSVIGKAVLTSLFGSAPEDESHPAEPVDAVEIDGTGGTAAALAAAPTSVPIGAPAAPAALTARTTAYMRADVAAERVAGKSWLDRWIHAAFADADSGLYRVVNGVIMAAIVSSVLLVIVESVESIFLQYETLFHVLEGTILTIFTLEYLANIYLAGNKMRYLFSFWGVVDLLAILPSYLALMNFTGVKVIRTLRILRILRILKLTKIAAQRAQDTSVRRQGTFWLDLQIYLITLSTAVVISSTLVYYAERDVPMTSYTDIPNAMWWAIVTITTTGYGDMQPMTAAGRIVGGATMLTGLALFGILTSVIGRAMMSSLFGSSADTDEPA